MRANLNLLNARIIGNIALPPGAPIVCICLRSGYAHSFDDLVFIPYCVPSSQFRLEKCLEIIDFDLVLAAVTTIVAGAVYGFAGFGSGFVLIPVFSLIFGVREALASIAIMATLGGIGMMMQSAERAEWNQIGPLCICALLVTPLGIFILLSVDPELMRRVIGGLVVISAAALMMGLVYKGTRNLITSAVAGVLVGLAHGAVGLGGLTASLYILSSQKPAIVQRASIVVVSTLVSVTAAIIWIIQGTVDVEVAARSLILMIPFGITVWCGTRVFSITPGPLFRRIVLLFVMFLGVITLFS